MSLQSHQPASDHLSRSHSAGRSAAESRDPRLDIERQGRELLKAEGPVDNSTRDVLKRGGATENAKGLGEGLKTKSCSPNPNPLHLEVFSVLKGGVDSLSENDYGRPWPDPKRGELRRLTAGQDRDLCLTAAWEAREIVQAQDRAPNITALFGRKLTALTGKRAAVRKALGES